MQAPGVVQPDTPIMAFLLPRIVHAVNTDPSAAPSIKHFFGTEEGCRPLFSTFQWDPNLHAVLTDNKRPNDDFWFDLEDVFREDQTEIWTVYSLRLEHETLPPINYIGIATHAEHGSKSRNMCHKNGNVIPLHVATALRNGYHKAHHGILGHRPKPKFHEAVHIRDFMKTVEAYLSFALWTMAGRTEYGYGMSSVRLWHLDAFEYLGACSHSSMKEGSAEVTGEVLDLTEAEAEELQRTFDLYRVKRHCERNTKSYHRRKAINLETEEFKCTKEDCPSFGRVYPNANGLRDHEKQHDKAQYDCRYKDYGCEEKLFAKNISMHERWCLFTPVPATSQTCKYAQLGCTKTIREGSITTHERTCGFAPVEAPVIACKFTDLGCPYSSEYPTNVTRHEKGCTFAPAGTEGSKKACKYADRGCDMTSLSSIKVHEERCCFAPGADGKRIPCKNSYLGCKYASYPQKQRNRHHHKHEEKCTYGEGVSAKGLPKSQSSISSFFTAVKPITHKRVKLYNDVSDEE